MNHVASPATSPSQLPVTTTAWRLYGAGMENFGDHDAPCTIPLRNLTDQEILCRVDAIGLCFSDIKIIRAGSSHPKIWIDDLSKHPLIIGHEAVLTILKTGTAVPPSYAPGQRYVIQPDVYVNGKSCAYGYGMNGGLTQYSIIDQRVWKGETESYLLPAPENLPAVSLALLEPWTCVRASYHVPHRTAPRKQGRLLIVTQPGNQAIPKLGTRFHDQKTIVAVNFSPDAIHAMEQELGRTVTTTQTLPHDQLFDDVVCFQLTQRELGEQALAMADYHAVISFIGDCGDQPWAIDVGALHYKNRYYQGTDATTLDAAYEIPRRKCLREHGTAWFPGGAGAMGQMHVELAIVNPQGPDRILVTDLDDNRLAHLKNKLEPLAQQHHVQLTLFNPKTMAPDDMEAKLRAYAPQGFDDVVILVPSAKVIDQALPHLADNGLLNVFAGIPAGETSQTSIRRIIRDNIRFTGSSGSNTQDMREALKAAQNGEYKPQSALAAIAGMNAVKQGYQAAADGVFPGKIVVLPHCPDLPLTPFTPQDLPPVLAETLDDSNAYTAETEAYLIRQWGQD